MSGDSISTESAERLLLIANTPGFFLNSLRSDAAVQAYALRDSAFLLGELEKSANDPVADLRSSVLPYVLFSALILRRDTAALERASEMKFPNHPWMPYAFQAGRTIMPAPIRSTFVLTAAAVRPGLRPEKAILSKSIISNLEGKK